MINTDKYEGHTPGPWKQAKPKDSNPRITTQFCGDEIIVNTGETSWEADMNLIADTPLLLERVIHLEHIVKCARDVLTNIYTYDKDLEDAEWIAWFCDMESEEE